MALLLDHYAAGNEAGQPPDGVQAGISALKEWSEMCWENFGHKTLLLEGLQEGLIGDVEKGIVKLCEAAAMARDHGYWNDEGLAWEYAAYLQKTNNLALTHLEKAFKTYERWGARGKIDYLREIYG
jgi:hypothetical protein